MEPIIFNRPDVREMTADIIKCGGCTGVDVSGVIADKWFLYAGAIKYINSATDNTFIYLNRPAYQICVTVQNAIDTVIHEMHENCSVKPVLYSQYDEFELREIEESHFAFEQIKNGDYEFVRDRAYELGVDACHMHFDNENQLIAAINGTDIYRVKFRVYFGDLIIGEIE